MAPPDDHVSPREVGMLAQAVEGLTAAVGELRTEVSGLRTELSDNYVRKDVLAPQLVSIGDRVTNVETDVKGHTDWLTWAQRIIIGAVMAAVLAYAVFNGSPPS